MKSQKNPIVQFPRVIGRRPIYCGESWLDWGVFWFDLLVLGFWEETAWLGWGGRGFWLEILTTNWIDISI